MVEAEKEQLAAVFSETCTMVANMKAETESALQDAQVRLYEQWPGHSTHCAALLRIVVEAVSTLTALYSSCSLSICISVSVSR